MKVTETHSIGKGYDEYGGKGSVSVEVVADNGEKSSVTIYAGEPEDNVFFRDLSGALSIGKLVKAAYEAGKRGEPYEYEFVDESEEESV
jgi:hypothetical protein